MRIVNRKTFLELPANTLFAKYEPYVFGPLEIKGETCFVDGAAINDFSTTGPLAEAIDCMSSHELVELLREAEMFGNSVDMDFAAEGRDGLFEDGQLFAVFDSADVSKLIERLKLCIPNDATEPAKVQ